jgi:RimJ/RimL family protein N-acetyltransferase
MASIPALSEPLHSEIVTVRDAAERDIPEILIAYQDDPGLHLRLRERRPPSGAELGRLADTEAEDRAAGLRATLTILEAGDDICRGQIRLHDVDWDHRRAGLTVWLAPRVRGRGMGAAALGLVAPWLLEHARLLRLQILADPDNAAMVRAARAAGFSSEGVLRGYRREPDGRRVDAAVLSLLPGDLAPR